MVITVNKLHHGKEEWWSLPAVTLYFTWYAIHRVGYLGKHGQ